MLILKSLHIIFVITWFAGLFYIVRLFIYHREAQDLNFNENNILSKQYLIMQKRLWYGITWPSAVLASGFGFSLIQYYWPVTDHSWLMVKLFFILGLWAYHFSCGYILKLNQLGHFKYSSLQLRAWNEVATIFLFAIVFLATLKNVDNAVYGFLALLFLSLFLFAGIKLYKRFRDKASH